MMEPAAGHYSAKACQCAHCMRIAYANSMAIELPGTIGDGAAAAAAPGRGDAAAAGSGSFTARGGASTAAGGGGGAGTLI